MSADNNGNFDTARERLTEIVTQVRKKDLSLDESLDLLEEGVRLANRCTELIDQAPTAPPAHSDEQAAERVDDDSAELAVGAATVLAAAKDAVEAGDSEDDTEPDGPDDDDDDHDDSSGSDDTDEDDDDTQAVDEG